jgi:hypothetical protein
MPHLTLVCQDCGQEFAFTEGEQEFYRSKGLDSPQYCYICRSKHKAKEIDLSQYQKKKSYESS